MINKIKISYVANVRLPTEKAHGLQIMDMLECFKASGADTELLIPNRTNPISGNIFNYYGKKDQPFQKLWCWDLISYSNWLGPIAFFIESITFACSISKYVSKNSIESIIYTRDLWSLLFVSPQRTMIYEVHSLPKRIGFLYKRILFRMGKIIAITNGLKKDLVSIGYPESRILVAPDGVNLQLFQAKNSLHKSRLKLGLSKEKTIVMYTGHLYAWKGVGTVLETAAKMLEILFVFVGGTQKDKDLFMEQVRIKKLSNVEVRGHVNQEQIPDYLDAADILVLPNSANTKISAVYTSPLKLFEYMASGRPIAASQLPSIQEILNEETATFFLPDNPDSLAQSITKIIQNYPEAQKRAKRAQLLVQNYTWSKRADAILNFI